MALTALAELDQYRAVGPAPDVHPDGPRSFFSPVDDVHGALLALIKSATESLVVAVYGFDDQELADALHEKLTSEQVFVQLTLDSSQAGGVTEKKILTGEAYPASSVAIGRSEKGAIMHLKMVVVDALDVVDGSTNWSGGGESKQDNQLCVTRDRTYAARCRARIDAIHHNMLQKEKS